MPAALDGASNPSDVTVDVTIVLPVFNELGHLEEEITRIRKTMDESDYSYEVIVVDDGSTDGTAEIVREFDVRLVQTENRGLSAARNLGLELASGEIIA